MSSAKYILRALIVLAVLPACSFTRSDDSSIRIRLSEENGREARSQASRGRNTAALTNSGGYAAFNILTADAPSAACFFIGISGEGVPATYRASQLRGLADSCATVSEVGRASELVSYQQLQSEGVSLSLTMGQRKFTLYAVNIRGKDSAGGCGFATLADAYTYDPLLIIYPYASTTKDVDRTTRDIELTVATTTSLESALPKTCYDSGLATPTGFSLAAVSLTEIDLQWNDNNSNESGFWVERSADGIIWERVASLGAGVTGYSNTGLSTNTTYFYRVATWNEVKTQMGGMESTATPPDLAAPASNPSAVATSTTGIRVSWTDNSDNEDGFYVERSANGVSAWLEVANVGADVEFVVDSSLTPELRYFYRVRPYNGDGTSDYTSVVNTYTLPTAPTGLNAGVVSSSEILLNWTLTSSFESGVKIERSTDGGLTWGQIHIAAPGVTAYPNTGLSQDTRYDYRIRVFNGGGDSAYSSTGNATTKLATPTGLAVTARAATTISLSWTDVSNSESSYKVEKSLTGSGSWSLANTESANATTSLVTGLLQDTDYSFRVYAYNGTGDSDVSNVVDATTKLATPTGLTATGTSASTITVSWNDISTSESGYKVERSLDNSNWSQVADRPANATSYGDTGLNPDTKYYYRVYAYDGSGNTSDPSNVDDETTWLTPPSSLGVVGFSETQINLTWNDNSATETGFEVWRSLDEVTWTLIETTAAGATGTASTGLSFNTRYYYQVRAKNAAVYSAYTTVQDAVTPLNAPSSLGASVAGDTAIGLVWVENSNNETSIEVEKSDNGGTTWGSDGSAGVNATTHPSTGLTANQTYHYRVRAKHSGSGVYSAYSNTSFATPTLSAPSLLSANATTETNIALSWTDNSSGESGFKIEESPSGGAGTFVPLTTVGAGVTSYNHGAVTPSAAVYYRVYAYNGGGNSAYSNTAYDTPDLAAPTSLAAAAYSDSAIDLSWTDNSAYETGFEIDRSPDGTNWTPETTAAANAAGIRITGLSENVRYYFRVRAYLTGQADSSNSNTDSAYTKLKTPTSLLSSAPAGGTKLVLTWDDNSTGEDGFKIEQSTDGGTTYNVIDSVSAGIETYTATALQPVTSYKHRVRAYVSTRYSEYSNIDTRSTAAWEWIATESGAGSGVPSIRYGHTAIWTGTKMIVWGGTSNAGIPTTYLDDGGIYDPSDNTWTAISTTGAPAPRAFHTAVWTGTHMIVWGGRNYFSSSNSGGVYDPGTNSWKATNETYVVAAPTARYEHSAVWTGTEMIIWGGSYYDTGGRFDPTGDDDPSSSVVGSWEVTDYSGASVPSARSGQTAVWDGSGMVVWGGYDGSYYLNDGGRYDPSGNSWAPIGSGANLPAIRSEAQSVWTGTEMIVWGGYSYSAAFDFPTDGGLYDSSGETWTATQATSVPSGRKHHATAWTGEQMVVWGGTDNSSHFSTGALYDPTGSGTWTATPSTSVPAGVRQPSMVWTGTEIIVWGGYDGSVATKEGARLQIPLLP